ncbi:hypothetical protein BHE74_00018463 [Ensete ventricosum]|nr:hypothetical protein GW17_00061260 [Ensete ventricosum]RWW73648.1 hypothetical protein BHE74_00018463 [Ensete ventricosum]
MFCCVTQRDDGKRWSGAAPQFEVWFGILRWKKQQLLLRGNGRDCCDSKPPRSPCSPANLCSQEDPRQSHAQLPTTCMAKCL